MSEKNLNETETVPATASHTPMSPTRKKYIVKLIFRCIVFIFCAYLFFFDRDAFTVISKGSFASEFSLLHILFAIWILDMLLQIIPIKNAVPLGSQKHFRIRFKEINEGLKQKVTKEALKKYVVSTTKSAYIVFLIWVVMLTVLGALYFTGVIDDAFLFMVTAAFYVCDLICVLIWCPFRLIVRTRCCTTCRIYNWDHLMMFSPMMFIMSTYSTVLVLLALAVWVTWEACVFLFPERFWEQTNSALKCSECTDKLCTQYCQKLRK